MDRFSVFSSNSVTEDRSMDSTASSILFGKILPYEEGDIVYEDSGLPHKVKVEDMRDRAQRFNSALVGLEDIKFEVEKPVNVEKSEMVKIETTPEPPTKIEDPDEVVVLKKKRIHKKQVAKRSDVAAEEAVDYSKIPNVLSSKPGQNNKQQRKRRFDPSFNDSEGPRAPKKKRPTTRGKNVSFKR